MIIINNPISININNIFICFGNPNPCLLRFRLAAGAFFFEKKSAFFEKARFGLPKPCLLRFRLAACVFVLFFERHAFLKKCVFFCKETDFVGKYLKYLTIFVNIYQCAYLPYGTAYCTVLHPYLPVPYE